jgi:hypothetical protein
MREIILARAYEIYKQRWCESRGYNPEDADEENGFDGELYVCMDEFECCEFQEDECMSEWLNELEFAAYKRIA